METLSSKAAVRAVFLNVLYDDKPGTAVPAQYERLPALADSIRSWLPDVVGLCEVEGDNGENLAAMLDMESKWTQHDRPDEHIGFLARSLDTVTFLPLDAGASSIGCITEQQDITFAYVHLNDRPLRGLQLRRRQLHTLLGVLANRKHVVLGGDFNITPGLPPRSELAKLGYTSVFNTARPYAPTVPIPGYAQYLNPFERAIVRMTGGLSLDDVYTRGVRVLYAQRFRGLSDHEGSFVEVEPL